MKRSLTHKTQADKFQHAFTLVDVVYTMCGTAIGYIFFILTGYRITYIKAHKLRAVALPLGSIARFCRTIFDLFIYFIFLSVCDTSTNVWCGQFLLAD